MKLTLRRQWFTPESTIGELLIDDVFECFTLELPVRDGKPGSAIPCGTYPVRIDPSPRFRRDMPELFDIPGRSTILIHWGNSAKDTEGCILVGRHRAENYIGESRAAFEILFPKIALAEDCTITVSEIAPAMGVEESTT